MSRTEREETAIQVLRSLMSCLLEGDTALDVVGHWTRYPPYPDCTPDASFEFLVEKLLFEPVQLEITTDHLQLFDRAPTLRIPFRVVQEDSNVMTLLAQVVQQHSAQLFTRVVLQELERQVTLRGFRFAADLPLMESMVPRDQLLLDVVLRYLVCAHASGEHGGPGFSSMVLQMRAAVDRLYASKRREMDLQRHELPHVSQLRLRHLSRLQVLDSTLRLPSLYDMTRRVYDRQQQKVRDAQQRALVVVTTEASVDRFARLRQMTRIMAASASSESFGNGNDYFMEGARHGFG